MLVILRRFGILEALQVDIKKFVTFLQTIEAAYNDNPYHNAMHAADVVSMCCYLLQTCTGLMSAMSPIEVFAFFLAACIHDVDHTGTNNNFHVCAVYIYLHQVVTRSKLALRYNDHAVLENHHVSSCFNIIFGEPSCNFFDSFRKDDQQVMRSLMIELVLCMYIM